MLDRTALQDGRSVGSVKVGGAMSRWFIWPGESAPNIAAPTDPGYDPNEQVRTQVVFGDWTPKNLGPHPENVEVYSNCQEVELFLNGRSLGSKAKDPNDRPRNWMVTFEPGSIKAACTGNGVKSAGKVQPSYEFHTAGTAARILLTVDKARLTNDWNDVVFVTATVVDANGVPVPDADNLISFNAMGAGSIVAVDSADNTDHDPFQSTKRRAFQGRCLAYIKTDRSSGTLTVTASSERLQSNRVNITVTK